MNFLSIKQSLGKISLTLAFSNILFFFIAIALMSVISKMTVQNSYREYIFLIWMFFSFVFTIFGIIAGVIGFFTKRAWIALVLNILFGTFTLLIYRTIFNCCVDY